VLIKGEKTPPTMHKKPSNPPSPPNWDFKHIIYDGGIHLGEFSV